MGALLPALPDLVFRVSADGRVLDGHRAESSLIAAFEAEVERCARRVVESSAPQTLWFRLASEGRVRDYEARLVPFRSIALAVVRDVTDQLRTEEELQLFLGTTLTLAEAKDFEAAMKQVLRLVCEATGWVVGQSWTTDEVGTTLVSGASWVVSPVYEAFQASVRGRLLARGEELAGRAWARGQAMWIAEIAGERDVECRDWADAAKTASLSSAVAVPVLADDEVVAVLEFFAAEPRDVDERLLNIVSAVAEQLGTAVKRRRGEERLHLLDSAVGQASEAIVIASTTAGVGGPRIVYVSPPFSRLTGWTQDEALGRGLDMLTGPETNLDKITMLRARLANGEEVVNESVNYRKDGSTVQVEWRAAPVREADGSVTRFIALLHDITQRKHDEAARRRLQESLEAAARQWRLTFDAIDAAILLIDGEGKVLRLNRAARDLSGQDYSDWLGCRLSDVATREPWRSAAELVNASLEQRTPLSIQTRSTGSQAWTVETTWVGNGVEASLILVIHDVTKLVELQQSLRRSQTMSALGAVVAGVAHEVRNPLQAISATLDAFEARFGGGQSWEGHLRVLRGEVARLTELMHELLEYGKPVAPQLFRGSIADVFRDTASACAANAARAQVTLDIDEPRSLPPIMMDRGRLLQVFQNIVENALQHSRPGLTVRLDAVPVEMDGKRWLECTVVDDGLGFDPDDLGHVFEPFFTRRRGGTGLGLSIVERIVDAHGGQVRVGNRAAGGGLVAVRLPIGED